MKEELLHHFWSSGLLKSKKLHTTKGESLHIIHLGNHNKNSGPDFLNATIEINGLKWIGNVEIHIKSSNWRQHKHSEDPAYKNVILHVVFESDVFLKEDIPTLELKQYYSSSQLKRIASRLRSCAIRFESKDYQLKAESITSDKVESLVLNRLERKSEFTLDFLNKSKNDWQSLFFIMLCRNMGFQVNDLAFELMAQSLPLNVLRHHLNDLTHLEALFFGQASLIPGNSDSAYANRLKMLHRIYAIKYRLHPVNRSVWKFSRVRPANFPTIRISQLASLLYNNIDMIYNPVEYSLNWNARKLVKSCPSVYWLNHYDFDKESSMKINGISPSSIDNIAINTIVPFLYVYEKTHGIRTFRNNALNRLSELSYERNFLTNTWLEYGVKGTSALESQAFLELKLNTEF